VSFPVHLLRKDDAVLSLFVAAFHGAQDLVPIRDAGCVNVIAVDRDAEKLDVMRPLFPDYVLHAGDAFTLIEILARTRTIGSRTFSVITSDSWTGDAEPKVVAMLSEMLQMTKRVAIIGFSTAFLCGPSVEEALLAYSAKSDREFTVEIIERTKTASWLVVDFTREGDE
jgi:hypothetical protein